MLGEFLKAFPQVDVQLGLQDRLVSLLEEHVDVALRIGVLADSSLIAVRAGEIHRVVCASPAYLKARGTPKSPEELKGHDCISYAPLVSQKLWTFMRGHMEFAVPVQTRLVVGNLDSAYDAARAGMGITMAFSYNVAASVKAGTLITLMESYQPPPLPVSIVYSSGRFMPIKLRAFLDFVLPRLKEELAAMAKGNGSKRRE